MIVSININPKSIVNYYKYGLIFAKTIFNFYLNVGAVN